MDSAPAGSLCESGVDTIIGSVTSSSLCASGAGTTTGSGVAGREGGMNCSSGGVGHDDSS